MPLPVKDSAPVERQLLRDVVYNRLYEGILDGTLEPGETLLDEKLTAALHRLGVPTRDEIRNLTQRVEELNAKIEQLKPRVTPASAPVDSSTPVA